MAMTPERAHLVESALRALVITVNLISEEDIDEILRSASREMALGPLINPTTFMGGNLFDNLNGAEKVLWALLEFKKEVKGIGNFK